MDCKSFSWSIVSRLLGQPFNSAVVQDFLAASGVDAVRLWKEVPIGLSQSTSSVQRDTCEIDLKDICGARMRFKMGYLLAGWEEFGSQFLFSGITYYAEGEDVSAKEFSGEMPFGLTFGDSEQVILSKIGRPCHAEGSDADGIYRFRRWDFSDYVVQVVFFARTLRLRRVFAFLPLNRSA